MYKQKITFYLRVLALFITLLSIYLFAPWQTALYYLYPLPDSVEQQVNEANELGLDGIIVYIDQKGKAPESYTSGWHNRTKKIPAQANALFKIGSIRKLYDAAALAKLVALGKIDIDKTLADYLPELATRIQNAHNISLKMMVQHKSGIPNYTDTKNFDWSKNYTTEELLALILNKPAEFEPSTNYQYSNTNYLLLRRIMTKVLGYDHNIFIQQQIFEPLQLEHSYISVHSVNPKQVMSGYYVGYNDDFKLLDQGFVATAQDVATFVRALNDGSLFTPKEAAIYADLYKFEHTGWVLGYSSIARYFPDIDAVVVQFVNTNGGNSWLNVELIYNRIIKILRKNHSNHEKGYSIAMTREPDLDKSLNFLLRFTKSKAHSS